jgi:hypothetical protein
VKKREAIIVFYFQITITALLQQFAILTSRLAKQAVRAISPCWKQDRFTYFLSTLIFEMLISN